MNTVLKLVCDNPELTQKTCAKCSETKSILFFHKCSRSSDGFKSDCKPCRNASYVKKGYDSRRKLIDGGRICNSCEQPKTWDQFSKDKTGLNGKTSICIPCRNAKGREVYKINPLVRRSGMRDDRTKRLYGVSNADVIRTLDAQHGRCANHACGEKISLEVKQGKNRAMIDHNHTTGKFRALLCMQCNLTLGYLEKQENIILGLQDYLTKHNQ